tara:strand:- start:120 stop:284 length:165 start_codon:yes stop_codon:yes gene_type:complete
MSRSPNASKPTRSFDDIQARWSIGSPAVPGVVKRTLAALAAFLLLIAFLALLQA